MKTGGEYVVTLRAFDVNGNSGNARARFGNKIYFLGSAFVCPSESISRCRVVLLVTLGGTRSPVLNRESA